MGAQGVGEGAFTSEECAILLMTPFGSASPLILNTEHPDELFEQAPLVANSGLGGDEFSSDFIDLRSNPLAADDCANIQALINRQAQVNHDVRCPPPM